MSAVNDVKTGPEGRKMTSSVPTKLQKLWEIFVQTSPGTYDKSTWLDLFLAELLLQIKDGNTVKEILSFWPAGEAGISTLIGCELLGAVHRTCSAPGQTDDLGALRRLLLCSTGWRCLAVLHVLSVEGICCARELSSLLISLYPVCTGSNLSSGSSTSHAEPNPYIQLREGNVDAALQVSTALRHNHHHHVPQRKHSACTSTHDTRASSILSGGKSRRSKSIKSSPAANSSYSISSESETEEKSVEALNRSLTLKLYLNSIDLDYFSAIRSDDESRLDSPLYEPHNKKRRSKKLASDDFVTDELNHILKSHINRYEFSMLVVQILQKLSLSETYHSNEITQPISVQSLNFALEHLCSLQFGSATTDTLTAIQVAQLKSSMTQLVLVSLEKAFKTPTDVSMTIINNGILPLMLKILEDATMKLSFLMQTSETESKDQEKCFDPNEACRTQEFIFGVAYGIITILYYQLLQRSTTDKIRDFIELFRQFSDSQGGHLIEKTLSVILSIPYCNLNITLNRVKKIVDFLGQFIVALKKARADIVHLSTCHKTKHKQCRGNLVTGKHHHQDLFGRVYTTRLVPSAIPGQSCCVSSLFMVFVGLLHNRQICAIPDLQARIVKIMVLSGTCCCFPPRRLLSNIAKMLRNNTGKIRSLGFALLERALYVELGGMPLHDTKSQCEICDKHVLADSSSIKYFVAGEYTAQESLSETPLWSFNEADSINCHYSDASTESMTEKRAWDFLEQYKPLINSDDVKLSYITMSHLLRIAPRCTARVQQELLFKVFYPTFLSARVQYDADENEHSKFKILSCLSLFASLLGSVPFAEQFVNLGGLNQIVDLVNNADFSKACCAVLEITVIIEIWKLECELRSENIFLQSNNQEIALEMKSIDEMKNLPSLEMISNALEYTTREVLSIFESNKICSTINNVSGECSKSQLDLDRYMQLLHNAATFWRCCASLCLYSPQMRQYIAVHPVSNSGKNLLLVVLKKVISTEYLCGSDSNRERRLLVKLLEAVLAVNLTAPSDNSSVETTCATLRHLVLEEKHPIVSSCIAELCDALLRCATLCASPDQVMPPHCKPKLPTAPARWDDTSSLNGDAARRLDFSDSSLADAYVTADEGYDADVEIPPDYTTTESYTSRFEVAVSIVDSCSSCDSASMLPACEASPPPGPLYAEYCRGSTIAYAELCLLAIDLLINLNECNNLLTDENKKFEDILLCLQRLLVLCRDNAHNCITLANAGAISRLLIGFKNYLEKRNQELIEIQHAVLELVMLLSKHSLNRNELALYLQLFKADSPPLDLLLEPLVTLAVSSRPQPNHIVCFPAIHNTVKMPLNVTGELKTNDNAALQMLNLIRTQQNTNNTSTIQSAWTASAICLPINTELGWSMWLQGFSACMWLRVAGVLSSQQQQRTNSDRLRDTIDMRGTSNNSNNHAMMHLMSIGHESLLIELWIDTVNDTLIFRLTRPDAKSNKLISEVTVENCLPSGLWHHVALNIKDNIQKRKINIEITLLINGWNEIKLLLPVNGLLVRKCRPTCVLIGQIQNSSDNASSLSSGSWFLGNVMLFRCPVFTKERAIYLVGLGPNFTSLTECELDKHIPNFTSIFGPRTISNVIDWDSILDAGNGNLKELQDNLLLSYMAQNPNVVNFYPQVVSNSGGVVNQLFPSQPTFRVVTTEQRACQQLPLTLSTNLMAAVQPQHYQGLAAAAFVLGGVPVFTFLVARVVELRGTEQEQGMALRLLLRLIQIDGELHSQFQQQDGYRLLLCILSSSRCKPSQHILKAIIDTCCDKSILHYHSASNTFSVLAQTDAIVVAPALIRAAIGAWKAWSPDVLSALFAVLHALLRDDHPFREFNAAQMNRVHLVESLLLFCKERFLYDETDSAGELLPSICCSLVELIRSLMGAPPEFCHIVAVTDFLLLLHQASATYVTHVRSSFYFLLSDAIPVGQNTQNPLLLPIPIVENVPESSFTQPIDAQKLNKALANLKTRQGGLERRSRRRKRVIQHNKDDDNREIADSGISGSFRDQSSSDPDSGINMNDIPKQIIVKAEVYENKNDTINNAIVHELRMIKDISLVERSNKTNDISKDDCSSIIIKSFESMSKNIDNNSVEEVDQKLRKSEKNKSMLSEQIKHEKQISVDKNVDTSENDTEQNKNSQWLVVEGLLLLLRDTLLVLPDTMAFQVLSLVVKPEILLVMANHQSASVRTALVKVLTAYIQRSTEEELNKLIKVKYFHHLANQLSLYSASRELAGACGSLITRCITSLDDQIELVPWAELGTSQLTALPPLLAILPKTLHDTALAHHTLAFIMQIFTKVNNSFRTLLDNGLIEVLLRTLLEVCRMYPQSPTLLHDLVVLLVSISSQCLSQPGAHNMQIILDIHSQLSYLILKERYNENPITSGSGEGSLRAAQCSLFDGQLDTLLERLSACQQPGFKLKTTTSYLASVLSSSYERSSSDALGSPLKNNNPGRAHRITSSMPVAYNANLSSSIGHLFSVSHTKEVPRSELCDRLKTLLIKCIELITNVELDGEFYQAASVAETKLVRRIFLMLIQGLSNNSNNSNLRPNTLDSMPWHSAIWGARGSLRRPAVNLLVWLMSPKQSTKLRMFAVHSLREEPHCKDMLISLLQSYPQAEQKFTSYLWDLMYRTKIIGDYSDSDGSGTIIRGLSSAELRVCEEFKEILQCWGVVSPHCVGHEHDQWDLDVTKLLNEMKLEQQRWTIQHQRSLYRSVYKYDSLARTLTENAMAITRNVVEAQNSERKAFMEYMKQAYSEQLQSRSRWRLLVQQLTHEKAVWFFPKSYPRSWQLDATEGPLRVRKRLQRCNLNVDRRFILKDHQFKLESVHFSSPLSYLLDAEQQTSAASLLIERLHTSEKVRHMCTAQVITPALDLPGELLIGESCLHFVPDDSAVLPSQIPEVISSGLELSSIAWHFDNIREIHNRRFQLQERALEIFLINGRTYLVAFATSKDRDTFVVELSHCHLPNRVQGDYLSDAVHLWREGLITNWEYVMQLNKMAGRSYNDLMQYPVFPFVLADYTSETIDLSESNTYRNFKRPMAVQDKKNEQHYVNNYNYLKQAMMDGMNLMALNQEPFHYGSHYSNSGTVLHFMVRVPPFTRMFLSYQDNNFDIPDRTFHALSTTWRLTSCDSTTDVKELIPEFFYLPEFLQNNEGFNFGIRQNGEKVHNVLLPPWSQNDARLFTLIHRQAFEADFVRENLPHWIDLVFGYKQTGKAAVEAINVFHPATYYGFDVEKISDPLERTAWETMVRTYGQTPCQLFRSPHPMVVQPLTNIVPPSVPQVLESVKGLRWGTYVGSPGQSLPVVVWRHQHRSPVATLVPLITNDVFGLPSHTSILLSYSKEKSLGLVNTTSVLGAAMVTWGHSDNIVRVKFKKEHPPWPLVQSPGLDPMCICASVPDWSQLWIGHNSGMLHIYSYILWPLRGHLELKSEPITLLGHTGAITALAICPAFSIGVSGSQDGSAIIWDLNNLSYVRSIDIEQNTADSEKMSVTHVSISETLGDIAVVYGNTTKSESILRAFTINCSSVGKVHTSERITAICYSAAPEGISVNVIATGLETGIVKLWSSWNLQLLREISCIYITQPIISIAYSQDSQHLFVSASDGTVVIWESTNGPGRTPKFLNLTSL